MQGCELYEQLTESGHFVKDKGYMYSLTPVSMLHSLPSMFPIWLDMRVLAASYPSSKTKVSLCMCILPILHVWCVCVCACVCVVCMLVCMHASSVLACMHIPDACVCGCCIICECFMSCMRECARVRACMSRVCACGVCVHTCMHACMWHVCVPSVSACTSRTMVCVCIASSLGFHPLRLWKP